MLPTAVAARREEAHIGSGAMRRNGISDSLIDLLRAARTWRRQIFRRTEGERALRAVFRETYKKDLDSENPRTFSEKLFRRMVMMHRAGGSPISALADKYLVRDYVRKQVGERYLVKLLWQGTRAEDIPFDALPGKYMIKTNHQSGGGVLVDGDVDRQSVIGHFRKALGENYYWQAREYQYYAIIPRIIIEEFIDDGSPFGPLDFRIWCFHGVPEIIQFDNHIHSIDPSYDREWNRLDFTHRSRKFDDCDIARPENLAEILSVAGKLSEGIDFVRVDLYNAMGRILFGELTFTPRAGILRFKPEAWDEILGEKWRMSRE
jgi:TupA-like ATPgrasp